MFLNDNKPGFCQTELVLSHYKSLCNPHGDHVASKIAENKGNPTKSLIFSIFCCAMITVRATERLIMP